MPEAALLRLRKVMGVYANLRPAICFDALAGSSTLKPEFVSGLDLMIVRELTGGVYFGQPRGVEILADGQRRGVDTQVYSTHEIERVARVAFGLARGRRNKVTSCEKSNVMETGQLWREVITALHARDYAAVTLEHMLADNAAMQLVRNPRQFDVIVTDNLFGDMLSDEAAMLTGSIGLLPSAAILSFEMALRWSLGRADLAQRLWGAVKVALEEGARTRDIGGRLGTNQMGDAVLKGL